MDRGLLGVYVASALREDALSFLRQIIGMGKQNTNLPHLGAG